MGAELLLSRRDVAFLLYDWLDVESLTKRERYAEHSRETFDAVLDLCAEIAAERFAPHNKLSDTAEPEFVDGRVRLPAEVKVALDAVAAAGLIGGGMDERVGGLALPQVVQTACFAWFQAANIGTWSYAMLTVGNANLLLAHGSDEQVDAYVRPMVEGRFHGTMCLSEPQAGSSLADITTRAERADDGTFRLFGTKMWISGGDHELGENIVHLVLAKIPDSPPGVRGISLFLVPKHLPSGERNDVVLAGLNHKMGYRGTVNTALNFGEAGGAVGWLVGAPNQGLAAMFHMMNEARVAVGTGAVALGYTGYLKSLDYARTRTQGRPPGAKDPAAPPVPLVEHADVRRMLLAQKAFVEGGLGLVLYCGKLLDEERTAATPEARAHAHMLLEVLTPIAKSWPSQYCLQANDLAIQVHGGYGYTREYDVEQHYRDNRLNPIHEGTHGIQAVDLLGRKVVMADAAGLAALSAAVRETVGAALAAGGEAADLGGALDDALTSLVDTTAAIHGADLDPAARLANASVYLEAAGHVVVAWVWLAQFLATGDRDDAFHQGKRQAARYFYRFELPQTGPKFDLLARLDPTTVETDPGVVVSTPQVVVFDVNETLSDMAPLAQRFADVGASPALVRLWFAALLRDGFARTAAGESERFAVLAESGLRVVLHGVTLDRPVNDAVAHVLDGFATLSCHPDVPAGVRALTARGLRLVTMSNGAAAVAERLLGDAGLRGEFEQVLSVEDAGVWKPHPGAYGYVERVCGVAARDLLMVAVHPWDLDGAARAGLRTAWIDRTGAPYPAYCRPPDYRVPSLDLLADALG